MDDFNRLHALGLSFPVICDILDGKRDEMTELGMAAERAAVAKWCRRRKNVPATLTALWDLSPANFYLAFDGDAPNKHDPHDFALIEADVAEVHRSLTYNASRDKDPWHREYKSKSCKTAYRWLNGLLVTPPVIRRFQDQIHIDGGMHRYHLAQAYKTSRMPFLIRRDDCGEVLDILRSGIIIWSAPVPSPPLVSGGNPDQPPQT
ncbi:hypothetical protein [Rhizobium sp. BK418]|uniref:hypothetical protein n=1 Tax=Rhizobium sp. BK418 TaxID=2512120 RepID=UPI0010500AF6|nr:hypothetical protein [Rhizobium sp. BK418]